MGDATTRHTAVRSGAASLAVSETGSGSAVVLLHAGVADRCGWHDVMRALASRFRLVAYDRRGYGETTCEPDPDYRAELARWTGADARAAGAGVPPAAFGASAVSGHAAPFPLRDFAGGQEGDAARPTGPLERHPVVAVLATDTDRPADWLAGGQALMRVLLAATAQGLASSQLNQPVEFPTLRQQLRDELRLPGWPQVVLRLGYPAGPLPPPTPRRPAADVLLP